MNTANYYSRNYSLIFDGVKYSSQSIKVNHQIIVKTFKETSTSFYSLITIGKIKQLIENSYIPMNPSDLTNNQTYNQMNL